MNGKQPTSTQSSGTQRHWWLTGEGVTLGAGLINVVLAFVKIFAGVFGNSSAMLADGMHSLSDLATDVVVLVGYRVGRMPGDEKHPYGHGKIEALATLFMGTVVGVVGLGLLYEAAAALAAGGPAMIPGRSALMAAVASIIFKETLYRWTVWVARDVHSQLILSNAWHHRTDAISSVAALIGIAAARHGYWWGDPAATLVVGAFIVKVGWGLALPAFRDLSDATVEGDLMADIERTVSSVAGVRSHHSVKARRAGADLLIAVDIEVDPELNVVQGHEIAREVSRALHTGIRNVRDTLVHVEPLGARDGLFAEGRRDKLETEAARIAGEDDAVLGVHGVRVVPVENGYLLNLDIELSPTLTVAESHGIADRIKRRIADLDGVHDVVVHVDIHGA